MVDFDKVKFDDINVKIFGSLDEARVFWAKCIFHPVIGVVSHFRQIVRGLWVTSSLHSLSTDL
jgi:hypothetical protein